MESVDITLISSRSNRLILASLLFALSSLNVYKDEEFDKYSLGFEAYIDLIVNRVENYILELSTRNPSLIELTWHYIWRRNAKVNTLDITSLVEIGLNDIGCDRNNTEKIIHGRIGVDLQEINKCIEKIMKKLSKSYGIDISHAI